jgi:hypothetical protein
MSLVAAWDELVTAGLLGTDRRDPPPLPPGPVADVVADALAPTAAVRLLDAVAAITVARRAGLTPFPSRAVLQPPPPDPRPLLPVAAARRWHGLVAHWPVLEPEWIAAATASGWRPAPDVLVAMLRRARRSPGRHRAVMAFGGASARWLLDHLPELGPADGGGGAERAEPPEHLHSMVPVELKGALELGSELPPVLVTALLDGTFRWSHRAVLLNTVAAVPPPTLPALVEALSRGRAVQEERSASGLDPDVPLGLWHSLIELATVRLEMLRELGGRRE